MTLEDWLVVAGLACLIGGALAGLIMVIWSAYASPADIEVVYVDAPILADDWPWPPAPRISHAE